MSSIVSKDQYKSARSHFRKAKKEFSKFSSSGKGTLLLTGKKSSKTHQEEPVLDSESNKHEYDHNQLQASQLK